MMADNVRDELAEARESLAILEGTERFLIEEVGAGGGLTLENTGRWAEQVRETRRLIASQRAAIAAMETG
jgi:hypothetical protein